MEYLYCPRFIYFMYCLDIPQYERRRYKVRKGRGVHDKREETNRAYLRQRLGCLKKEIGVPLASDRIGVKGIIDEILYLADGSLAPLDYKYSAFPGYIYMTHKMQSVLSAMLICENYHMPVLNGYICYIRDENSLQEITYGDRDFKDAENIVRHIFDIIDTGLYPEKTERRARCEDCCYHNICTECL